MRQAKCNGPFPRPPLPPGAVSLSIQASMLKLRLFPSPRGVIALIIINKAGGLIYNRTFSEGLNQLNTNDYLVLAGTFHGYASSLSLFLSPSLSTSLSYSVAGSPADDPRPTPASTQ
jgi:hypothetical protein